jgi:hypothetical protein
MKFMKSLWFAILFAIAAAIALWVVEAVLHYQLSHVTVAFAVIFGFCGVLMGRTLAP